MKTLAELRAAALAAHGAHVRDTLASGRTLRWAFTRCTLAGAPDAYDARNTDELCELVRRTFHKHALTFDVMTDQVDVFNARGRKVATLMAVG